MGGENLKKSTEDYSPSKDSVEESSFDEQLSDKEPIAEEPHIEKPEEERDEYEAEVLKKWDEEIERRKKYSLRPIEYPQLSEERKRKSALLWDYTGHSITLPSLMEMSDERTSQIYDFVENHLLDELLLAAADVPADFPKNSPLCLLINNIIGDSITYYNPDHFDGKLAKNLGNGFREYCDYALEKKKPENGEDFALDTSLRSAIRVVSRKSTNPDLVPAYIKECVALHSDFKKVNTAEMWDSHERRVAIDKMVMFRSYCEAHGLDEERLKGFHESLFPQLEDANNPIRRAFDVDRNYGSSEHDFGSTDFIIHALVQKVSPRTTSELIAISRELPTTDIHRLSVNRQDALSLGGTLWQSRDFIHNERPGLHELFSAMVDYYDTKDNPEAHEPAESRLRAIIKDRENPENGYEYDGFDGEMALSLGNYDKMATAFYSGVSEPAIDILRRMKENTEPILLIPPKVEDAKLQELLDSIAPTQNETTGEVDADFKKVANLIAYLNGILESKQGKYGLEPSLISALNYAERMATFAIRRIGKKDYQELGFDPGLKELVKFNELTCSDKPFNATEFEQFWNSFTREFGKDWDEDTDIAERYCKLSARVIGRVGSLAESFRKAGMPSRRIDELFSGNLTRELIALPSKWEKRPEIESKKKYNVI